MTYLLGIILVLQLLQLLCIAGLCVAFYLQRQRDVGYVKQAADSIDRITDRIDSIQARLEKRPIR